MPPFVVVVTSPTCANSALLLTELTLISLIDSAEGNISVSRPLERTLMVEMPSTDAVAMNGIEPGERELAARAARLHARRGGDREEHRVGGPRAEIDGQILDLLGRFGIDDGGLVGRDHLRDAGHHHLGRGAGELQPGIHAHHFPRAQRDPLRQRLLEARVLDQNVVCPGLDVQDGVIAGSCR